MVTLVDGGGRLISQNPESLACIGCRIPAVTWAAGEGLGPGPGQRAPEPLSPVATSGVSFETQSAGCQQPAAATQGAAVNYLEELFHGEPPGTLQAALASLEDNPEPFQKRMQVKGLGR